MSRRLACGIVVLIIVTACLALPAPASAQGKCTAIAGTITGQHRLPAGTTPAGWYGQAYLSFGRAAPVFATVFDRNAGRKDHPARRPDGSGNFAGDEILTFTVDDLGSFQVKAHFIGVAGTTPYFYAFNESGEIEAGTDAFAGVAGHVSIHGSFVAVWPAHDDDHPWLWIAQITGSICGLE